MLRIATIEICHIRTSTAQVSLRALKQYDQGLLCSSIYSVVAIESKNRREGADQTVQLRPSGHSLFTYDIKASFSRCVLYKRH